MQKYYRSTAAGGTILRFGHHLEEIWTEVLPGELTVTGTPLATP